MLRVVILFHVLSQVSLEMQSFQHQIYISRKSRSNTDPITTGFVYNKVGEGPGSMTTFDNTNKKPTEKYVEVKTEEMNKNNATATKNTTDCYENWGTGTKNKELYLLPKHNDERAKAETKCLQLKDEATPGIMKIQSITETNSDFIPKSIKEMFTPYIANKEFRIDDEDVRTDSRNTYNGWPYSYNGPYDYQVKNFNAKNEKAKDKRFLGVHTTNMPIQDNVSKNIPVSNAASSNDPTIDNPIYGDQPFFSFVLNDYFDRHHEEEPLVFKDFSWSEDFENGLSQDVEDNERHSRRLHSSNNPNDVQNMATSQLYTKTADKESVTEKAYDNNREYEKHQQDEARKDNKNSKYNYNGHRETAFKDFVDLFANKFGSQNANKNSNFMLKTNQDKGGKRKGFKRVYHKDEYQEDNEFYDNTNKSAQSEENGGSNFNIGGSQSFLQSKAVGSAGKDANSSRKIGNKDDKMFGNVHKVNEKHKERDGEINHYRNIAKDAALSNNADYIDNFRI